MKLKSKSFVITLGVAALTLVYLLLRKHYFEDLHFDYYYRDTVVAVFYASLFLVGANFVLLFFIDQITRLWWKKFMVWFAPLAVILIASGTDGSGYVWLPRTDLSVIVGSVLVVITLIFALVQRFYYKVK